MLEFYIKIIPPGQCECTGWAGLVLWDYVNKDFEQRGTIMEETGLKPELLDSIIYFAKECKIKKVILFGSRARGDFWRASDIDLAIEGGSKSIFSIHMEEDTPTLLSFDVIDLSKNISLDLREMIQKEGVVLYEEV